MSGESVEKVKKFASAHAGALAGVALLGFGSLGYIQSQASSIPKTECLIKGNINDKGQKIYHVPPTDYTRDVDFFYGKTQVDESKGERWFCTVEEAEAAGWRAPKN